MFVFIFGETNPFFFLSLALDDVFSRACDRLFDVTYYPYLRCREVTRPNRRSGSRLGRLSESKRAIAKPDFFAEGKKILSKHIL